MHNTTVLNGPRQEFSGISPVRFIKFFKYELLKLLIFLLLFVASVMYVNSQSELYYHNQVSETKDYSTEKNN